MNKKALITGISGQDGSFLAEFLLEKGYEVHGTVRRHSVAENQSDRLNHIKNNLNLHYGDLTDSLNMFNIISKVQPDEIYNLAAQSHVKISYEMPQYTFNVNSQGLLNILEAVRIIKPDTKIYQASTSEMFGNNIDDDGFQRISTKMEPVSPYGCSKLAAHTLANNYKNAYGLWIVSGVLFNHESPRRGTTFLPAKVVKTAVEIKKGLSNKIVLGNLDSKRDWGHAKDYVRAMWLMLQQDNPKNYVCATGKNYSVKELVEYVFNKLNLNYEDYLEINSKYFRPEELDILKGDSSQLRNDLGWSPLYSFEGILDEMIEHYLQ